MMVKLINWIKNPRNIVFIILMIVIAIYGIINNNLEIIIKVYIGMFLFGLLVGGIIYLVNKLFK
ncbi:hypothetical protein SAMN04488505_11473 [Chitinophaga rupis]|uniref:Uncharacterized protein n=1 Tax=Chitinophaga rupis TaxID=573321 RepID=A0A1H8K9J4_9BACT|nr:hypothetical protein SAMN04488505_11473 [Chitinophaga rupis]